MTPVIFVLLILLLTLVGALYYAWKALNALSDILAKREEATAEIVTIINQMRHKKYAAYGATGLPFKSLAWDKVEAISRTGIGGNDSTTEEQFTQDVTTIIKDTLWNGDTTASIEARREYDRWYETEIATLVSKLVEASGKYNNANNTISHDRFLDALITRKYEATINES